MRVGILKGKKVMKRMLIPLVLALAACSSEQRDGLAQDAARTAVKPVLAAKFPGVPLEPATDCIINNATSKELLSLAADAVTGPTASTVEIVTNIAQRPEALTCLATEGLPELLK